MSDLSVPIARTDLTEEEIAQFWSLCKVVGCARAWVAVFKTNGRALPAQLNQLL